jgi:ethanolamine utilization protein EutA
MKEALISAGIDIGTSTTQVIFSKLQMEDVSGYFSAPRVDIVSKEIIYKGTIYETPLISPDVLDLETLKTMLAAEFDRAGFAKGAVDTGAAIITGESALKENARLVLEALSGLAGDFVVATAGPDLEAVVAGQGSGARDWSLRNLRSVVNLDIGGGTSNIALFEKGELRACGSVDVGGRRVRIAGGKVRSVSGPAAAAAEWKKIDIRPGDNADAGALERLCGGMAEVLEMAVGLRDAEPILERLRTPGSAGFRAEKLPEAVFLSGGVADLVYHPLDDDFAYGDIGVLLGRALRKSALCTALPLKRGGETIRATVVGAGSYTVNLSGSTIFYRGSPFPRKNLPVLRLTREEETACYRGEDRQLMEKTRWFLSQRDADQIAFSLAGLSDPGYGELNAAAGVFARIQAILPGGVPLVIIIQNDMAKALGQLLSARLPGDKALAVLDSVSAGDNTFIDIGMPLMNGITVPVVVKTLIFG